MFLGVCQEPATGRKKQHCGDDRNRDGHKQGSFVLLIFEHCKKILSLAGLERALGKGTSLGAQERVPDSLFPGKATLHHGRETSGLIFMGI